MIWTILTGLSAVLCLTTFGFILGVKRGQSARQALRHDLTLSQARAAHADSPPEPTLPKELLQEVRRLVQNVPEEVERSTAQLKRSLESKLMAVTEHQSQVMRTTAPLLERERLSQEIQSISTATTVGRGMEDLIEQVMRIGSGRVSAIIVNDDSGLPLASNRQCRNPEAIAALSTLLFLLADRTPHHVLAPPRSISYLSESGQRMLHTFFRAQQRRYVLTVLAEDSSLDAAVFAPLVEKVQRILAT